MTDEKTAALIESLEALRGTFPNKRLEQVNEAFIAWLENGGKLTPEQAAQAKARAQEPAGQQEDFTEERFYTPLEAAKVLRVSSATIYRAIKEGRLKVKKIGQQYRINGKDLADFGSRR